MLMRRAHIGWLACSVSVAAALAAPSIRAELVSKRYEFKTGARLAMAVEAPGGLRLDTVRFKMPSARGDRLRRTGGLPAAEVAISNTAETTIKVGVAIALFDDEGRMLAVASGGNQVVSVRPGRQKTFSLLFDGVNAEAHKATAFQISAEVKP